VGGNISCIFAVYFHSVLIFSTGTWFNCIAVVTDSFFLLWLFHTLYTWIPTCTISSDYSAISHLLSFFENTFTWSYSYFPTGFYSLDLHWHLIYLSWTTLVISLIDSTRLIQRLIMILLVTTNLAYYKRPYVTDVYIRVTASRCLRANKQVSLPS
jgi:hypothetical protein